MGTLPTEIRQTVPFATPSAEAAVALLRTADLIRRRLAAAIEPSGITLQQYNVLRILRGAGPEGLPTLEVAARLIERTPGITRLCVGLASAGLLARVRPAADRRVVQCRITAKGLRLLAGLDAVVARADADAIGPLPDRDVHTLLRLLERVRRSGT